MNIIKETIGTLTAEGWDETKTLCGDRIAVRDLGEAKAIVGETENGVYLDIEDDETEILHEEFSGHVSEVVRLIKNAIGSFLAEYGNREHTVCTLMAKADELNLTQTFEDLYETMPLEEFGTTVIMPFVAQQTGLEDEDGIAGLSREFIDALAERHAVNIISGGESDRKYDIKIIGDFLGKNPSCPESVRLAWKDLLGRISRTTDEVTGEDEASIPF